MNQDNQVYSSENAPASVPQHPESGNSSENQLESVTGTLSPLSQETDNPTIVASPINTQFQTHLQIISSGNAATSVTDSPATTGSSTDNQLASTTLALSPLSQESNNPTIVSSHLQTQFQPDLQITSSGNAATSVVDSPETARISSVNKLGSTTQVLSPLSQETDNPTIIASPINTQFQTHLQITSSGNAAISVTSSVTTIGSFSDNHLISKALALSPLPQESNNPTIIASHLNNQFLPQITNAATFISKSPISSGSSRENQPVSTTLALSSVSQQSHSRPIFASHFQPYSQITSSVNTATVGVPVAATGSPLENQLASTTLKLSSLSQEGYNSKIFAYPLNTQFQPRLQILSVRNAETSVEVSPAISGSSSENKLVSTIRALCVQESNSPTIFPSHLHTQFQPALQIIAFRSAAMPLAVSPETSGSSSVNELVSTILTLSSLSQEVDMIVPSQLHTQFLPPLYLTSSEYAATFLAGPPVTTGSSSVQSTFQATTSISNKASKFQGQFQPPLYNTSSRNATTLLGGSSVTTLSSNANQSTFQASTSISNTASRFPVLVSLLQSIPKKQETSVQPGQKTKRSATSRRQTTLMRSKSVKGTLSSPTKIKSAVEQGLAIYPKQRSLSSPAEITFSLKKQALIELSRKEARRHSIESKRQLHRTGIRVPEIVDLASPSEMTTDPYQSSESSGKPSSSSQQQPHTSSHESHLKNLPSEHSFTDKKDANRLERRLVLFDKFICVKCFAGFKSQEQLLKHEPIHFNE